MSDFGLEIIKDGLSLWQQFLSARNGGSIDLFHNYNYNKKDLVGLWFGG